MIKPRLRWKVELGAAAAGGLRDAGVWGRALAEPPPLAAAAAGGCWAARGAGGAAEATAACRAPVG
eukprot:CAMPEP_0179913202 /NCGR_PEP_ID=MMETSP0983-20121128/340_1 /TAXON_ID=483367 /ORGANISM="non described non described, Strain CCMP 2436" /LENGTH=65 /DNA_ID=CAMNT_0021815187 /DNA_START=185 /DNA_END=379 /DNA_ORIENTATION=+